ncbi:three prime repair exonuclease 2-like [Cydia pomonella]|uniref:three prime repair exonuclease 2-like n=1 Tax=Cydia pomonella TaxID=82600 RepID=UPI002ADD3C9F|nr:three prime repair exonuclease 2-like [Cydia pomonella]
MSTALLMLSLSVAIMAPIATYVFLDLGTTGKDPKVDEITEFAMVAVNRQHLLETSDSRSKKLRVQNKLIRCFKVDKKMTYNAKSNGRGGFKNEDLQHECYFDKCCFLMIDNFLNTLKKPVCLIAHNGGNFDFPILKRYFTKLGVKFSDANLMYADTLLAFSDIIENTTVYEEAGTSSGNDLNENPPKKQCIARVGRVRVHAKNRKYPNTRSKQGNTEESYKLTNIYKRLLKKSPRTAHQGEADCNLMLKIAEHLGRRFVNWINDEKYNICRFPDDVRDP